mgnify:CR=1 FL=1
MLNNFKINFRGMEVIPTLEHTSMYDTLDYDIGRLHVSIAYDNLLYQTIYNKKDYEERVKYIALEKLEALCNEAYM